MKATKQNAALAAEIVQDWRWGSIVSRDKEAVGKFYYSVRTAGVYCLPSCAGRLPKPENVRFHATPQEAELAGFRPCKRCKPNGLNTAAPDSSQAHSDIVFAIGRSSLGWILVASNRVAGHETAEPEHAKHEDAKVGTIRAILLGDDSEQLIREVQRLFPKAAKAGEDPSLQESVAKIINFIEQPGPALSLPLDIRGTAFQQRVWRALLEIPSGSTASYADIARKLGRPSAIRAVAKACAANPLAVLVPCHRVVRSDGTLSGYRWGVERKRALLEREACA
ncbi:MAG TPA: methylated-DNA--[protein]-cysteine S-methyltransferase [Candidatus Angelobacter sp.]|nr:methylated-DNA--[protein]-cysteine S-methyltransferase [Candidatus Angelobacter sp.]